MKIDRRLIDRIYRIQAWGLGVSFLVLYCGFFLELFQLPVPKSWIESFYFWGLTILILGPILRIVYMLKQYLFHQKYCLALISAIGLGAMLGAVLFSFF
jgi:hypothetical protein